MNLTLVLKTNKQKSMLNIKYKKILLIFAAMSMAMGGCTSYEKSVRENLKIPHVFVPPNDAYQPYTLLHYDGKSNFTPVCSVELLTNKTKDDLNKIIESRRIVDLRIRRNSDIKFEINLNSDDLGEVHAKYNDISAITISFTNGRQLNFPTIEVADIYAAFKSTRCADNIRIFSNELETSRFLLPIVVFGYDLDYKVFTKSGGNITGELPEEVMKLVAAEIDINFVSSNSLKMAGNGVYIGFRGLPVEKSIFELLWNKPQLISQPNNDEYVLDVTDIINNQLIR
jgi:hypothetical protein